MTAPLAGVLVADFTRVLAGPLTTMTLADLGATVVKVERPGGGDDTRSWGPPWSGGSSTYFESVNRSKYGIALDFTTDSGRSVATELARRADVVVENFRPGVLTRHGLGYESIASVNKRVVYCSITAFGDNASVPGYDFTVQAMGGLMSITGDEDGEPRKVGVALVDVLTSRDAVIAILAALSATRTRGYGEHVRVSLLTSLLGSLVNQAANYLTTGAEPKRMGNRHPSIVPYETMQCADELLAIAPGNDHQFVSLLDVLGCPELTDDARFTTNAGRVANRERLVSALERRLRTKTAATWEARLEAAGVPASRIGGIGDGITRADRLGLAPVVDIGAEHTPQIRHPARYSASGITKPSPPPRLGEHTDLVLEWLRTPLAEHEVLPHPSTLPRGVRSGAESGRDHAADRGSTAISAADWRAEGMAADAATSCATKNWNGAPDPAGPSAGGRGNRGTIRNGKHQ